MIESASRNVLLHGAAEAPETPRLLCAGPLHMEFADGQLRRVRLGDREIVRRVYAAVRDGFWNTVPGVISGLDLQEGDGTFTIRYHSEHRQFEADFAWDAEITGAADGTLRFVFDGTARRTFPRNRIGLCVLHPDNLAGADCEVDHVSGETAARRFPELVDPMQPVRGLHDFVALRHAAAAGVSVEIRCEGDVFEIEDQRNWTDNSFKTYSTPQRIPLPGTIREGQRVRQVVTVRLIGDTSALPAAVPVPRPESVVFRPQGEPVPLPALGLCLPADAPALTSNEAARLAVMGLGWLRADLDLTSDTWAAAFDRALNDAAACGVPLEVVLHLPEDPGAVLGALRERAEAAPGRIARWLVLTKGRPASPAAALTAARAALAGTAPVGGGTDADFFQLNNNRPPAALMDFVSVPLRPLAHQFDLDTLFENLAGQRHVLRAAAAIFPGLPVRVSPLNFRTRAQKGPPMPAGQLPAQADARQPSMAAAAWLLGCLQAVTESGAAGVTLFQTVGLRGVMECAAGSSVPGVFHAEPGQVYPLWFVPAALAGFAGGTAEPLTPDTPDRAGALLVRKADRRRLFLANFTASPCTVRVEGLAPAAFTVLDAAHAAAATADPDAFLAAAPSVTPGADGLRLDGFAVAWADL